MLLFLFFCIGSFLIVVLCGVRLKLMVGCAHSWLLSVLLGGSGRLGQKPFRALHPPGRLGPRGLGPAQLCFPSLSSEPEQGQAVQGLSHGGRYVTLLASSDLGGWSDRPAPALFPRPGDTHRHMTPQRHTLTTIT